MNPLSRAAKIVSMSLNSMAKNENRSNGLTAPFFKRTCAGDKSSLNRSTLLPLTSSTPKHNAKEPSLVQLSPPLEDTQRREMLDSSLADVSFSELLGVNVFNTSDFNLDKLFQNHNNDNDIQSDTGNMGFTHDEMSYTELGVKYNNNVNQFVTDDAHTKSSYLSGEKAVEAFLNVDGRNAQGNISDDGQNANEMFVATAEKFIQGERQTLESESVNVGSMQGGINYFTAAGDMNDKSVYLPLDLSVNKMFPEPSSDTVHEEVASFPDESMHEVAPMPSDESVRDEVALVPSDERVREEVAPMPSDESVREEVALMPSDESVREEVAPMPSDESVREEVALMPSDESVREEVAPMPSDESVCEEVALVPSDESMHERVIPLRSEITTVQQKIDQAGYENIQIEGGSTNAGAKKRKRKADPSEWEKNIQKKKREQGQTYIGRKYDDNENTSNFSKVLKPARRIGERCNCVQKKRQCKDITDAQRIRIFENICSMSWNEKEVFVQTAVTRKDCEKKTVEISRRSASHVYHLKVEGQLYTVCKAMFLSTTGLRNWWMHHKIEAISQRENNTYKKHQDKLSNERKFIKEFLNSLPKVPSHYCRKSTSKQYLEPVFQRFSDVYKLYTSACGDKGIKSLTRPVFMEEFHNLNLGIFQPRKDQCDLCCAFETGNVTEEVYNEHVKNKDLAQQEKRTDKAIAQSNPKMKVVTMDLQRVLLCPSLKASALYYKTKLCLHNFTIFDLATHDTLCYVWHEVEGGLSANEFATCLYKYMENCKNEFDKIIIYSDGCSYQNRNSIMATALRHFAAKHAKCIEQKFLEKGHTQMEVDSCHSKIEQRLKNRQIYVPTDYLSAMEEARQKPFPYRVNYLYHDFFLNFASFGGLKSIRPGRVVGDPTVTNLKQLQYLPDGKIMFKLNHDDSWAPLPMKRGDFLPNASEHPSQLYNKQISVPKSKFDHLQQLKTVIPKDHHLFYDNLPYN